MKYDIKIDNAIGYKLIEVRTTLDNRGESVLSFSDKELKEMGIDFIPLETMNIFSKKNVLRGIHYQKEYRQSRLITLIDGSICVTVINIDKNDKYYGCNDVVKIDTMNQILFISSKCAVGTLAIKDSFFICSFGENIYIPGFESGIYWNDPFLNIKWPLANKEDCVVSERDSNLPFFKTI